MRVQLDATPQELSEKGEELIKALVRELAPVSPELAENLEKALPEKEPALKYRALRDIHKITKEEYAKTLERIHLDIAKVLSEAVENTSVGESMAKSMGPFIGPRGGKWADPEHTIPWQPDVPHEQIQQDAHAAVQPQVVQGSMRAAAAGAHAPSLRYVGSGGEGMVFADEQGKAHKVSRNRRPGDRQKLRNEAEANQALMGTPAEKYVAKVHNYNPDHDVLTRDFVQGRPGTWGSQGLREAYDSIAHELEKKGWSAPEFKEDSFIHPEGGGPPKMVDLGFVNPKGEVLVNRLKERIANLDPKEDFFDLNLDITYAYNEGGIDLPTAMGYLNTAIAKLGQDAKQAESERKELAFSAKMKGDLKEGQTWKDVKAVELSQATPAVAPSQPVASEPASLSKLREQHGQLSPDEQRNAYFKDRNTGLLNERGAELRQRDPQRPMTARFSMEGFKAFNDKFGHEAPDGALRLMGNELSQHIPDGVKRGGDIEGDVRDQAHADQIAERMSLAIDPSGRVKVTATAVKHGPDTAATLEKLGNAHKAHKDAEVEAGRLGHRMQHPAALGTDKARAHEAMRPIAARMQSMGPGKGAELNTEHHAQFAKLDPEDAFKTIHQEKSSGLLSDDGFKKSLALNPTHYVASADLRGVKAFNDAFGKKDTDSILRKFSELLTKVDGHSVHAAHPHGDEFMAHHEDPEKLQEMFSDLKDLTDKTILIKDMPNGKVVIQNGLHFAHGIGRTMDEADRINLPKAKEEQGDVQTPITWGAEDGHREIERLREAGYSVFDVGRDLGEDVPRGKSEKGSEESSGAASAAPQQVAEQATLPAMSGTPARPKVRTPVKAKANPEEAPLPGQRGLFNPQKVVAGKPKQREMFAVPPKQVPQKPAPENKPLPGQLPLIKALPMDPVQDIIDRESIAYRRMKEALIKRGYEARDFERDGVLYGKSVNELLGMVRSH